MSCYSNPEDFKGLSCEIFQAPEAMTMALSVLVTIEMLNALNSVSENQSLAVMPPWTNWWLIGGVTLSMALHFLILYIPVFTTVFNTSALTVFEWGTVMKLSFPVILLDELLKHFARRMQDGENPLLGAHWII